MIWGFLHGFLLFYFSIFVFVLWFWGIEHKATSVLPVSCTRSPALLPVFLVLLPVSSLRDLAYAVLSA
jgi:hypothetical protein